MHILPAIPIQANYHAGHYRNAGAMPSLRFNTHNVHKQCSACNHLSWQYDRIPNQPDSKIGQDRVEWRVKPPQDHLMSTTRRVKRVFAKRGATYQEVAMTG